QSGIQAGDGGYQIKVKGHTQLDGGVIASSKKAEEEKLNILDTGTFNYQDINNEAWFKAMQITGGINVDYVGGVSAVPPVPLYSSDAHSNVTKSTVGKGNIIIRDEAGQLALTGKTSQEIIAGVNRNSEDSHKPLEVIFDEEKIRAEFEIVKSFSKELGTFIQNKMKSEQAYEKELEERLNAGESKDSPSVIDLENKIEDLKKWAPGGTYRQISTALTAALSGNVGGTNIAFVQSFAANYLQSLGAEKIKEIADNIGGEGSPGHIALHALLGCAAGSVTNTCAEAAMGAAAGVVVNSLLDDPTELDPVQREKRKDLVTSIIAGIATGLGSENVAAITNSTQIETENNFLNFMVKGGEVVLMIAGRMLTVYTANEIAEDLLSVTEGNRSFDDLAKEYGEDFVVNYIVDKSTKSAFKIIRKSKVGQRLENKYEEIAEKGKEWLIKKGYKPEYIKLKEKQYADINALATGDTSVEILIKENGIDYVINDLSKIRRDKGIDLIKSPGGNWVVKVTDPETKYYTLVTPKPSVGLTYQNIEESKYLKEIIEGKTTWQELVDKKGIDYVEKLVKSKQSEEYWKNELVNPGLTIKGDKENEIFKKWDEGKNYLVNIDPKLKDKGSVLGDQSPYSSREVKEVIGLTSGKKGSWNIELNNPKPNKIYNVDNTQTFETDHLGRAIRVEGTILPASKDRNTYQQNKVGKLGNPADEGGHLIATILGGPGEKINLVPMDGNLNKGEWKKMENLWATAKKEGKEVNVKIEPTYSGDSKRPEKFRVEYLISGDRPVEIFFKNTTRGK
uniref:DNA/RNA non-specific endonuclease n=1 Tax=Fluviispira vulneris TaxID=2763012 RepID=UPI001C97D312